MAERMLKLFAYGHLEREDLLAVSKPFAELAERVVALVPAGPERTVSLRKLLEAKGCRGPRGRHPGDPGDRMNALVRARQAAQADIRSALRRRRRALGLTQEQAAQWLGMHRLAYHRIETGVRRIQFAELGEICAAFGCQIGDLVHDRQLAGAYVTIAKVHDRQLAGAYVTTPRSSSTAISTRFCARAPPSPR